MGMREVIRWGIRIRRGKLSLSEAVAAGLPCQLTRKTTRPQNNPAKKPTTMASACPNLKNRNHNHQVTMTVTMTFLRRNRRHQAMTAAILAAMSQMVVIARTMAVASAAAAGPATAGAAAGPVVMAAAGVVAVAVAVAVAVLDQGDLPSLSAQCHQRIFLTQGFKTTASIVMLSTTLFVTTAKEFQVSKKGWLVMLRQS